MNSNDRKHLAAHLAAVQDCIQTSDVTNDPQVVSGLEELLLAVKILADEVNALDRAQFQSQQP